MNGLLDWKQDRIAQAQEQAREAFKVVASLADGPLEVQVSDASACSLYSSFSLGPQPYYLSLPSSLNSCVCRSESVSSFLMSFSILFTIILCAWLFCLSVYVCTT